MDLGLKGKRAIISGGSRGIGRATAELLAAEGADIAFFSRNAEQVAEAQAWLTKAADALGGVDIFVHNASAAGGFGGDDFWYKGLELDVLGAVRGCETLEPYLEKSETPAVVFLSSTAAVETFLVPQAFNAMKAALLTYAKQLSQLWSPKKIRVNSVSPGPVYFQGGNWSTVETHMKPLFDQIQSDIPFGRYGSPDEIARAIVFLASPASSYTTGTNLVVDGGYTKRVQF
jgi:3-oxoacyl-[acyl-carrier protein] reductase